MNVTLSYETDCLLEEVLAGRLLAEQAAPVIPCKRLHKLQEALRAHPGEMAHRHNQICRRQLSAPSVKPPPFVIDDVARCSKISAILAKVPQWARCAQALLAQPGVDAHILGAEPHQVQTGVAHTLVAYPISVV